MRSIRHLGDRYDAAVTMASGAIEICAVADELGAYVDAALRRLILHLAADDPDRWGVVLSMGRQLRWRLATDPCPAIHSTAGAGLLGELSATCTRLRLVADPTTVALLDDLLARAEAACAVDRPAGSLLEESMKEVGFECAVVAASARAADSIRTWFADARIDVPVLCGSLRACDKVFDQLYAIGSPSIFGAALYSAPIARHLAYLLPSWVNDRALPRPRFADQAEGAIRPAIRKRQVGVVPVIAEPPRVAEEELRPQPVWGRVRLDRPVGHDEVQARRVLLAGGYATLLDHEGELIRMLYPDEPVGERLQMGEVPRVAVGSYLVLREGKSDAQVLYDTAIDAMGAEGVRALSSQQEWKRRLSDRIAGLGKRRAVRELTQLGVHTADRVVYWTSPTVARPRGDQAFEALLQWLGLDTQPHFGLATTLRRARLQASADMREELEKALAAADLAELRRVGFLRLNPAAQGFRGITATRVVAIAPGLEPVHRREVRVLMRDRRALWLE